MERLGTVDHLTTSPGVCSPPALGVTIVVCCHNSAQRLPTTLEYLLKQTVPAQIEWEVVVVDNGSTDETGRVARSCWPSDHPTRLRIVKEEQLGLSRARTRGLIEARHEVVCFVDDDNWLCPAWVEIASTIMSAQPDVAVCGGESLAVFEEDEPEWFGRHARNFAVGRQGSARGYHEGGFWGAGLTIRKSAWAQLSDGGFEQLLTDRHGGTLSSGGDTELCVALMRLGWKQWYEPALRLQHYIPASRARWEHLRRLRRAFGAASIPLRAYYCDAPDTWRRRLGSSWFWYVQASCRRILRYRRKFWRALRSPMEGDPEVIELEHAFGTLAELWRSCGHWTRNVRRFQVVEERVRQQRQRRAHGERATHLPGPQPSELMTTSHQRLGS